MDLRQLKRFVALAETLHYGQAAKRLAITQPSLSQSIQRLEQSMGVELLARTRRRVDLTAAGQSLLVDARDLLARADLARESAKRAARQPSELKVGYVSTALYRVLPVALARFRKTWPGVEVRMTELSSAEQLRRLRRGELDFAFVLLGQPDISEIVVRIIERTQLCAVVPLHSPFAKRKAIRLSELSGEPFVFPDKETNPVYHALAEGACRKAGFEPNVVQHANNSFTTLKLVSSGIAVSLSPAISQSAKVSGIRFIPLADGNLSTQINVAIAWMNRPLPSPSKFFVNLVEEVAGRTVSAERLGAARKPARTAPRPRAAVRGSSR